MATYVGGSEGHAPSLEPTEQAGMRLDQTPPAVVDHVDAQAEDEASRLRSLATDVRDQDDLERDIGRQVKSTILQRSPVSRNNFALPGRAITY